MARSSAQVWMLRSASWRAVERPTPGQVNKSRRLPRNSTSTCQLLDTFSLVILPTSGGQKEKRKGSESRCELLFPNMDTTTQNEHHFNKTDCFIYIPGSFSTSCFPTNSKTSSSVTRYWPFGLPRRVAIRANRTLLAITNRITHEGSRHGCSNHGHQQRQTQECWHKLKLHQHTLIPTCLGQLQI